MIVLLAAALASLSILALVPPSGGLRHSAPTPGGARRPGQRRVLSVLVLVSAALAVLALVAPDLLAWAVACGAVVSTLAWSGMRHRQEGRARRNADLVARACEVLAAQLQIGRTPSQALATAAQDCELLAGCVSAQRVGADVADALTAASRQPGAQGLASLARTWRLCERTGSRLSPAAQGVSEAVAAETQLQSEIAAELAVPRATGKLLAMLPVVGLAMGFMAGGDPVAFLTSTAVGKGCLVAAVLCACAGLVWTEAIAFRAGRES
ncbi:tight adherence protein B [Propionibacterium cyclohexanicum]|uniref:Tight adherence protein B n=1 Tax=Propionibacterium cyclohexanicum TaxID=64702 RepID=A0A1H9TD71_9ACTN|nr:type II secretion system F family protein [Propionibacterium cyclohexanicum]SER94739.1 tight adherence protein B [Propionibacterium cyclohexanicum]